VLTGTIGFYACYWFVRTIYASVKIDWEGNQRILCTVFGCSRLLSWY
jgi:hypothetical protein